MAELRLTDQGFPAISLRLPVNALLFGVAPDAEQRHSIGCNIKGRNHD